MQVFGDRTGRIHLHANHTARVEESQILTKTPVNLWIDRQARLYLSPLVYILGVGEVSDKQCISGTDQQKSLSKRETTTQFY
jgi:hypothetical protein